MTHAAGSCAGWHGEPWSDGQCIICLRQKNKATKRDKDDNDGKPVGRSLRLDPPPVCPHLIPESHTGRDPNGKRSKSCAWLWECDLFGTCTRGVAFEGVACCATCVHNPATAGKPTQVINE